MQRRSRLERQTSKRSSSGGVHRGCLDRSGCHWPIEGCCLSRASHNRQTGKESERQDGSMC